MPGSRRSKRSPGQIRETATEYGAPVRISATDAARGFSDLMNRVRYRGECFIIERGGAPIGELRPAAPARFTGSELVAVMRSLPEVDPGFGEAVEAAARSQAQVPEPPSWDS